MNDGWRDLDAWPPSAAMPTDWFLRSAGRARSAYGDGTLSTSRARRRAPDVFVYEPGPFPR